MFFSVTPKNLNWEILTKNLVAFKICDVVKDEKFEYYGDSLKILIFTGGEADKIPIYRRKLPKKDGLGQLADLTGGRGFGNKEGRGVFERGELIPQCRLWESNF